MRNTYLKQAKIKSDKEVVDTSPKQSGVSCNVSGWVALP
jgi:hypothetical protein